MIYDVCHQRSQSLSTPALHSFRRPVSSSTQWCRPDPENLDLVLVKRWRKIYRKRYLIISIQSREKLKAGLSGGWGEVRCRSGWCEADSPHLPHPPHHSSHHRHCYPLRFLFSHQVRVSRKQGQQGEVWHYLQADAGGRQDGGVAGTAVQH